MTDEESRANSEERGGRVNNQRWMNHDWFVDFSISHEGSSGTVSECKRCAAVRHVEELEGPYWYPQFKVCYVEPDGTRNSWEPTCVEREL